MVDEGFIIGNGVVGKATGKALGIEKHFDLKGSDWTLKDAEDYKYLFICVPTPTTCGSCNTSAIEDLIKQMGGNHVYVIRSTCIPGTAKHLHNKYGVMTVSHPEFLTMSTADEDAINPDIVVLGSEMKPALDGVIDNFYRDKEDKIIRTTSTTAEMIKYGINTFYASKVLFANALYDQCQAAEVDYEVVKDALYKRKWIGENHLTVPFEGKRGLGGACLPKDLEAFATYSGRHFFRKMALMSKEKCW